VSAVRWLTAAPLWAPDVRPILSPALLRFGSDTFMDDLAALLGTRPGDLAGHVATPRSFRPAAPGGTAPPPPPRLKLYQPMHGDFNLVAASLVCRLTGLPDHTVRPARAEQVAFVLRRTVAGAEQAWAAERWQPVPAGRETEVVAGEELLPMFPVTYRAKEQPRRLLVGLIPTSGRDVTAAAGAGQPDPDSRWDQFEARVIAPLTALRDPALPATVTAEQREDAGAMLLVDFADLLRRYLPAVWQGGTNELAKQLDTPADTTRGLSWRSALRTAWDQRDALLGESDREPTLRCDPRHSTVDVATLDRLLREALAAVPPPAPDPAVELLVPRFDPRGEATYRIRCLYRRPRCAPFRVDLVSAPTEEFTIAPLLDPDAPARQIRIVLPVDVNPRDLRKFRKNVGFLISNGLRTQLDRITGPKALDGELGEQKPMDLGVICQMSVPIIMICALVVLMIFLALLNIVFFWLPLVRICLPAPLRSRS
jgi:hypothetical protein